ncbi:acylphosphatase [Streptococcus dysgalactiae subsp. equisimilis]|mgnify:FL=1|nr:MULTISPECIES: acylphosphatase [Streptococcus]ADX23932.1 Acylphosphatase [Streptococcus dysgalactiae subsp. equisimilis ATCC 12394]EGL47241.1 acylphosphatase [Streptococcus dysgalactiae subsp. equisimilis SK1249]EGR88239.1 acylphosphatase [Streptococcus dysgalactiae subsp. equisimilis SK1250]BAN92836.1 acylphosphatase [Streptococcus dysgalactiae subsp. equisimilis 167]KKC18747.1 acylphosphatase [Streptococcus dysgalactiae subsp. equisimilis]
MKKVRLLVSGRVQGVGFRYATYALALDMGDIYGRVWNNSDGTVEILVQSKDSDKIAKFIQEVRKGPSKWAKVTYVDVTMANFEDFQDFRISN